MKNIKANNKAIRVDSPAVILTIIYIGLAALFGFAAIASQLLNLPIEQFTADPAVTFSAHPFVGIISYFGVLLWCSTAVACLFSFAVITANRPAKDASFLLYSGLISLLLLMDDLFMLHEAIFPWHLNIPQNLVYVSYFLIIAAYLFSFRSRIMDSEYKLFILAMGLLGLSVLGDFILPQEGIAYLVEDGFKVFGIATWFIYFMRISYGELTEVKDYSN